MLRKAGLVRDRRGIVTECTFTITLPGTILSALLHVSHMEIGRLKGLKQRAEYQEALLQDLEAFTYATGQHLYGRPGDGGRPITSQPS
ncbi:hypothetical protein EI42_03211 [Thermosporothrix hazakensis]|jgi:hypothetical protein|uniref:Uncharacterized protein n=2 Tax=Thermosporothrix TaxID=768650 RepID=A0A326U7D8_THEHA|nr:hypothetical protein [Thermosporothrix hazakensis]PZW28457.1 hypothetical protein EI42_03211 [Thermosporothrix hazakensis]BBH86350.1 hypothetical protein KTC_11010 [Thermosporothrix sp. COM3]GCE45235.1 hypothetical protein KTH_01040 [Thermosporothrix hazakensis]